MRGGSVPSPYHEATGSVADLLVDVGGTLRMLADLAEAEHRYPRWIRQLEAVVERAVVVRRRGGALPGVRPALEWIASTLEGEFWVTREAEPLRSEVERCLARIHQCL
jgi:hypothetical protein